MDILQWWSVYDSRFEKQQRRKHDVRNRFLADRTNGRAYATVLRLSVRLSVCDVMYCG